MVPDGIPRSSVGRRERARNEQGRSFSIRTELRQSSAVSRAQDEGCHGEQETDAHEDIFDLDPGAAVGGGQGTGDIRLRLDVQFFLMSVARGNDDVERFPIGEESELAGLIQSSFQEKLAVRFTEYLHLRADWNSAQIEPTFDFYFLNLFCLGLPFQTMCPSGGRPRALG